VTVRSRALVIATLIALVIAGCSRPEEPAPTPRPPTLPQDILFADDFESGHIDAWHNQSCTPDRVTVYTSADQPTWPAPPQGDRAVRLIAYDDDVEPCTPTKDPRAQILSPDLLEDGMEVWEGFSIAFPPDYPNIDDNLVQQDHGPPYSGSPPVAIRTDGQFIVLTVDGEDEPIWRTPLETGRWYRFVLHKVLSPDYDGLVELWVNGVRQAFTDGSFTYETFTAEQDGTGPMAFYLANYRARGEAEQVSVFFDDARIGRSLAAVL
jgi:Polysaccharide lyase